MSAHEKNLLKLLRKHDYTLHENEFGFRMFTHALYRPVDLYSQAGKAACLRLTRQVQQDVCPRVPETVWEADERRRAEAQKLREAADAARVRRTRLGGLAVYLTEPEIDLVVVRAEQDLAGMRGMDRLIRERPMGAGRSK